MIKLLFTTLLLSIITSSAIAQTIEAQGEAIIYNQDIDDARYRATQQAIKQATLQASSRVRSHDAISNGSLSSNTSIQSSGRATNTKILSESINDDFTQRRYSSRYFT